MVLAAVAVVSGESETEALDQGSWGLLEKLMAESGIEEGRSVGRVRSEVVVVGGRGVGGGSWPECKMVASGEEEEAARWVQG